MPQALISVSNKEGIAELASELVKLGYEIISTGGTYKVLADAGISPLKKIEEITGFPEIMDGRVKTLNPKVFGGILADRSKESHLQQAKENQIELIDVVICNLYPFAETVNNPDKTPEEIIENIDIGGPSLLRAASKNYRDVYVAVDPADYPKILKALKKGDDQELKRELAAKVFIHTAQYDSLIAKYFSGGKFLNLTFEKVANLRYGENSHQQAALFKESNVSHDISGIIDAKILHGKELSYNNIIDSEAALNLIREFSQPAAAVIKHTNPCGCAIAGDINEAFKKAYAADSLSAFGGIIVLNRDCTVEIAEEINKIFVEIVIAPAFSEEALEILKQKKNIRLLAVGEITSLSNKKIKDYRKIVGGLLEQDLDDQLVGQKDLQTVTKNQPSQQEINDLLFAWQVVKHVKSNAIVLAKNGVTVGIGAGQMSRVDAVDLAVVKSNGKLEGCVVASDAFFPFRDSIDKLAKIGIKSIIQPGGSIKDQEVIEAADEHKMAMVFSGKRAFKH